MPEKTYTVAVSVPAGVTDIYIPVKERCKLVGMRVVCNVARGAVACGAYKGAVKLGEITSLEANEHIGPYHGAFFMRDWRRKTGLAGGFSPASPLHDTAMHSVALGFVFAMVFGHAAIIFPAVLKVKIPYHPFFYVPLALLHLSLALRAFGGLTDSLALRQWGALANAATLAVFIATMIASVIRGSRQTTLRGGRRTT